MLTSNSRKPPGPAMVMPLVKPVWASITSVSLPAALPMSKAVGPIPLEGSVLVKLMVSPSIEGQN